MELLVSPSECNNPRGVSAASSRATSNSRPGGRWPPTTITVSNGREIHFMVLKAISPEKNQPACGTIPAKEGFDFSSNLGFVTLPSRQLATFASIRKAIDSDLDDDVFPADSRGNRKKWKFYVPKLGPVSLKQEDKLSVLEFLKSTTNDVQLGTGIASDPLKVVIFDV